MRISRHPNKAAIMEDAFAWILGYLSVKPADPIKAVRSSYNYIRWCLLHAGVSFSDDEVKDFIYQRSSSMFSRYGEQKTLCAVHALKEGMLPEAEEEEE